MTGFFSTKWTAFISFGDLYYLDYEDPQESTETPELNTQIQN